MPSKVKRYSRTLRLTAEEALKLKRNADACGMTQAGYIRNLINGYYPKEKPPAEFYVYIKKLYEAVYKAEESGLSATEVEKIHDLIFEIEKKYIAPEKKRNTWV